MFFLGKFQQLPVVEILTVALLIILTVYLIRKSIKLFFDKTSFLDEKREETLMHFAKQATKVLGLVFFFIYMLSHFYRPDKACHWFGRIGRCLGIDLPAYHPGLHYGTDLLV